MIPALADYYTCYFDFAAYYSTHGGLNGYTSDPRFNTNAQLPKEKLLVSVSA
jgi:hypothetical protein